MAVGAADTEAAEVAVTVAVGAGATAVEVEEDISAAAEAADTLVVADILGEDSAVDTWEAAEDIPWVACRVDRFEGAAWAALAQEAWRPAERSEGTWELADFTAMQELLVRSAQGVAAGIRWAV